MVESVEDPKGFELTSVWQSPKFVYEHLSSNEGIIANR